MRIDYWKVRQYPSEWRSSADWNRIDTLHQCLTKRAAETRADEAAHSIRERTQGVKYDVVLGENRMTERRWWPEEREHIVGIDTPYETYYVWIEPAVFECED